MGQGAGCLSSVGTYLLGTVGHGCRLFKWCGTYSLPLWVRGAGCLSGVEPTSLPLWVRGAGCLSGVGTYLSGSVWQGYWLLKQCQNLPSGRCEAGVLAF